MWLAGQENSKDGKSGAGMALKRREAEGASVMALLAIIKEEAHGALSDEFKAEYTKQADGTFRLAVTPVGDFALEDVKGLKSTIVSTRSERDAAVAKNKAFEGVDLEAARDALAKVKEMANWTPDDKVKEQVGAIKRELEEKHKVEIAKVNGELESLTGKFQKQNIDDAALKAFVELGGRKGSHKAILAYIREITRMRKTDGGELITEVLDDQGNPRLSPATGSTALMSIAEGMAELKTQDAFAPLFDGTGATGSGANGSQGSHGTTKAAALAELAKLPPAQRMEAAEKMGIKI